VLYSVIVAAKRVSYSDAMRLFGRDDDAGDGGDRIGDGAAKGRRGDEPPPETVGQLALRMKAALESLGEKIRVRGEVSNFTDKNHWYFSLKDAEAVIGCAMWQSDVARSQFRPTEGDEVIATGSLSFYPKQGRAQFYVRKLERVGQGSLQERYEALCRELRGLGYFDDARKLPLPAFPRRVAIITSATGAAIHDCLRTAALRLPAVGIVHVDVRVQGEGAADEVARAIRALDAIAPRLGIDAIVVTRGGGSIEDLWAFNERVVADAMLARRNCPIVAAIGHESDTTIAELVADRRASTPTQAMTILVPHRDELAEHAAQLGDRLAAVVRRGVSSRRELLVRIARASFLRSPLAIVEERRRAVAPLDGALRRALISRLRHERSRVAEIARLLEQARPAAKAGAAREGLAQRRRRLDAALSRVVERSFERIRTTERQLEAVAPSRVLARGFSYTVVRDGTRDGRLVRRTGDAPPGSLLETVVSDGSIRSTVDDATRGGPRRRRDGDSRCLTSGGLTSGGLTSGGLTSGSTEERTNLFDGA